ncbi:hypothetical protein [Oceanobacillus caeni]|uniref:Uncharacterized protein n=2 Tax=Bacillales TaxID=1385 RepID=A0ABR5MH59_9BACI|nr:hypothetical protein [Oceanobacillus caeni]KPH72653.1 hypothetical protein AFL42_13150 [Oceanobacillus caeni]
MSEFWISYTIGLIIIVIILLILHNVYQKYFKKSTTDFLKYMIPIVCIGFAVVIIIGNLDTIIYPEPIGDQTLGGYLISNKAILHLLLYIGILILLSVVWLITTFPFATSGLKKFSGFGVTAEFREKLNEVVESRSIINEMANVRETILNLVTSKAYFEETLSPAIDQNGNINTDMLFNGVLKTFESFYKKSQSEIKIKYHLQLIDNNNLAASKETVKELQQEMTIAFNEVMRKRQPYLWQATLAIPFSPFDMEETQNSYYILCMHSAHIYFNDSDIDFINSIIKIIENFVDLEWYKGSGKEVEDEAGETTESSGVTEY